MCCISVLQSEMRVSPVFALVGDLPNEAHVQTHGGGAPSEPPVAPEDRVPEHPHSHLPHLSRVAARSQAVQTYILREAGAF